MGLKQNARAVLAGDTQTQQRFNQALGYAFGRNDQGYRNAAGGKADSIAYAHFYLTVADSMPLQDAWSAWEQTSRMTSAQRQALVELCDRYGVEFKESSFTRGDFGLPTGYVSGQVGPIYVGVDIGGQASS